MCAHNADHRGVQFAAHVIMDDRLAVVCAEYQLHKDMRQRL
jgi:hypothetical protein